MLEFKLPLVRLFRVAALFAIAVCGPAWGENSSLPDEAAPFDIRTITLNGQEVRVHDFRDPNAGLAWLNSRLQDMHRAGRFQSCSYLAGVYLTRYEEAYGGACQLNDNGQMSEVKVCADTGVGNFNLEPLKDGKKTAEAIAEFVAGNCAGG